MLCAAQICMKDFFLQEYILIFFLQPRISAETELVEHSTLLQRTLSARFIQKFNMNKIPYKKIHRSGDIVQYYQPFCDYFRVTPEKRCELMYGKFVISQNSPKSMQYYQRRRVSPTRDDEVGPFENPFWRHPSEYLACVFDVF